MTSAAEQGPAGLKTEPLPADSQVSSTDDDAHAQGDARPAEVGGPAGPEPTRYGDWERAGRCVDF